MIYFDSDYMECAHPLILERISKINYEPVEISCVLKSKTGLKTKRRRNLHSVGRVLSQ